MKTNFTLRGITNTPPRNDHAIVARLLISSILVTMSFLLFALSLQAQIQWKDRYVCIAKNDQVEPSVARPANSSYTVVVWQDQRERSSDIYIEKIDNVSGVSMWGEPDGKPVCTASGSQEKPRAAYDSLGGIIVTWEDWRNNQPEIFAQRVILSTGDLDPNWTGAYPDGLPVCSGVSSAQRPRIVGSGDGAYIVWVDSRNNSYNIYLQFVTTNATFGWTTNGISAATSTASNQTNFEMASDNYWRTPMGGPTRTGVVVVFEDDRSGYANIFATARDRSGNSTWGEVALDAVNYAQAIPQLESTRIRHDGYIIVWQDTRNGNYDVMANVVDRTGNITWAGNTLLVSNNQSNQQNPRMTLIEGPSTYPYAVVTWEDDLNGNTDIFANQISIVSRTLNSNGGTAIAAETNTQNHAWVDSWYDTDYHAVIVWEDFRSSIDADIFAQDIRVPSWTLNQQSGGLLVTHAKSNQALPEAAGDVIVWKDARRKAIPYDNTADDNIYAQKLGTIPCDTPTVMRWKDVYARWSLTTDAENFKFAVDDSAETGSGGSAYVVWNETRTMGGETVHGVFVQKIDSTGCPRWENNGILLSDTNAIGTHPDVCKDGTGGAIVIWKQIDNGESDNHIEIAHVNAAGEVVWRFEPLVGDARISGDCHDPVIVPVESGFNDDGVWYGFIDGDYLYLGAIINDGSFYPYYEHPASRGGGHYDLKLAADYYGGVYLMTREAGDIKMYHALDPSNDPTVIDIIIGPYTQTCYTDDNSFPGYDLVCDPVENTYSQEPYHDALIAYVDQLNHQKDDIVAVRFSKNPIYNPPWQFQAPIYLTDGSDPNSQAVGDARLPAIDAYSVGSGSSNVGWAMVSWILNTGSGSAPYQVYTNGAEWDYSGGTWSYADPAWDAKTPLLLEAGLDAPSQPDIARIRHLDQASNQGKMLGMTVWLQGENTACYAAPQAHSMLVDYYTSLGGAKKWTSAHPVSLSATASSQTQPMIKTSNTTTTSMQDSPAWVFWLDDRSGTDCVMGTRVFDNGSYLSHGKRSVLIADDGSISSYVLGQNYPNPVSGAAYVTIPFELRTDEHVTLKVYNHLGQCIATPVDKQLHIGSHSVYMAMDDSGNRNPSGLYYYSLTVGKRTSTRHLIINR